jgi:hypothetical protein
VCFPETGRENSEARYFRAEAEGEWDGLAVDRGISFLLWGEPGGGPVLFVAEAGPLGRVGRLDCAGEAKASPETEARIDPLLQIESRIDPLLQTVQH